MGTIPIERLNSALEGRYTVEREIGEGGMATVFLADDLKHERKVALKVLKPELAAVVGAERFLSEIKVTANLQHPNILPLFDSGEADSFLFYVMPYVEGETLGDRLGREQQLHVDEAVKIATDLAEALDHAHRQKVVHRDIKPANVLLRDGRPLIADFGIALAVGAAGGTRLTETVLSVGTPYYMSPEQATGDQFVGPASDIYALACVLYEMLVGEPPFPGATAQAVLGKIIAGDLVSATKQRPSIPANIDAALRCALEKLPADRFTSAQNFARALGDPHFRHGGALAGAAGVGGSPWNRLTLALAGLAALFAAGFGWALTRSDPSSPVSRFSVSIPEDQAFRAGVETFDLSRDGSFMVYRGNADTGLPQLWLRRWDALDAAPIPDASPATDPAISPDGREVAFRVGGALRVVPLEGGVSRTLTDDAFCCLRWSPEGAWVYYANGEGLSRVPAGGGQAEVLTQPAGGLHFMPDPLPGGRFALYTATTEEGAEADRIEAVDLESGEVKVLTRGTYPRYSSTGHLLFVEAGGSTLLAAPFDADEVELTGPAVPVVEGLLQHPQGYQFVALSETGRLAYRTGTTTAGGVTPVWADRSGASRPIDPEWRIPFGTNSSSLALSPDGTRLVVSARGQEGTVDLYVKELEDGPLTRLTFEGTVNRWPTWSPDGQSLTFVSNRSGQDDLWRRRADGSGRAELVLDLDNPIKEALYSPDGEWLLFVLGEGNFGGGIYGIRLGTDSVPTQLIASEDWGALEMSLSPDGRWLAYASNRLGDSPIDPDSWQVWVQPFPDVDAGLWQVSTTRGDEPIWAHSGRELFYNAGPIGNQDLTSAQISLEPTFAVGQRTILFAVQPAYATPNGHEQKVSLDDQRFIMLQNQISAGNQLIVVDNFFEELKRVGN